MTSTSDECCTLKLSPSSHLTLMTALCLVNSLSLTHTHPLQFLCFSSILWKLFLGLHSIFVLHLTFNYGFPQGLCHLHFLPTPPRWVHLYPQFQLPLVYQWLIKPSPAFIQLSYPSPKAEIFSISSHLPHRCRDITLPKKVRLVKAMVFPVVMYGCESWTVKKAEHHSGGGEDSWESPELQGDPIRPS